VRNFSIKSQGVIKSECLD